ncbi:MAG: 50S ribosomal protein L4 [Bacteroidales bacterium]|nr:50S ribosomal protein L4 [Bacteroidales bacterium]
MKISIHNIEGKDTGKKAELNDSVFGIEPNDHAIYLDIKQHMANRRQGTHKAKERGEIRASTRKIKKQKGTGTARAGAISNPLFRGGGRVFGPRPRTYDSKLNKKVKQLARRSALSYKAKEKGIIVLEDFTLEAPKTNEFVKINNNLKVNDKKSLFILNHTDKSIYLSSRNLKNSNVVNVSEITTYDIVNASVIVLSKSSIEVLDQILGN